MKITKYGHCCLLIEDNGVRVLTDPGSFTADTHATLSNIDLIVYTHEHADHYHLDSLKQLRANNPDVVVICNEGVHRLLEAERIPHTTITDGLYSEKGVSVRGVSGVHEEIYATIPRIQNTGYMIAERFWYPGDAFIVPNSPVEICALPVVAPWMRLSEAVDYAITINPKKVFPVHDMILHPEFGGFVPKTVATLLSTHAIECMVLDTGTTYDF
jgi:L-ascorbate metabolism protein UlaG (beta-lactamase superfamily)